MLNRRHVIAAGLGGGLSSRLYAQPQASGTAAPLVVWINGDKGYEGIVRIGEAFTRETGVPLRVDHPEGAVSKFEQASAAGKGPDIWIWPHDRAGSWATSGLIRPVAPARRTFDAISPLAWSAWRLGGRVWGWPIAIESVALICNLDLVPKPPASWEEMFDIDRRLRPQGRHAIMWPYNEFYYAYGLASAAGGYAFARRSDGSWDPADTGVGNAGSRRGLALLERMVREGLVPRTATYAESEAAMNEGRVAMTINGPWAWNNLRRSGLRVTAAPLPSVGGAPGRPMVGVLGAMIATASRQPVLAAEFIEHWLISQAGLLAMHAHVPLGVPADLALAEKLRASDPLVNGTLAAAALGQPMPNIPEMARYWTAMNAAVQSITQGRETLDDALARAARRVAGGGGPP